jgi:hypothetical protein
LDAVAIALSIPHPPELILDPTKIRPGDPGEIFGDNSAIQKALDWRPSIPLYQTVQDVIEDRSPGAHGNG